MQGVAAGRFADLFGSEALLEEMRVDAQARRAERASGSPPAGDQKPYKAHLLEGQLGADSPYLRCALHERLLGIVGAYLGIVPMLRAADLWLTTPTGGPAIQTQLWHRDGEDAMNVKLFVYLSDVERRHGPFAFAPRTHPRGAISSEAEDNGHGRSSDDQMDRVVASEDWLILTGLIGTVVLADTCGYHKQVKPEDGERLLFMAQFTSRHPVWPATVHVTASEVHRLSHLQRRVLA